MDTQGPGRAYHREHSLLLARTKDVDIPLLRDGPSPGPRRWNRHGTASQIGDGPKERGGSAERHKEYDQSRSRRPRRSPRAGFPDRMWLGATVGSRLGVHPHRTDLHIGNHDDKDKPDAYHTDGTARGHERAADHDRQSLKLASEGDRKSVV